MIFRGFSSYFFASLAPGNRSPTLWTIGGEIISSKLKISYPSISTHRGTAELRSRSYELDP